MVKAHLCRQGLLLAVSVTMQQRVRAPSPQVPCLRGPASTVTGKPLDRLDVAPSDAARCDAVSRTDAATCIAAASAGGRNLHDSYDSIGQRKPSLKPATRSRTPRRREAASEIASELASEAARAAMTHRMTNLKVVRGQEGYVELAAGFLRDLQCRGSALLCQSLGCAAS